MKTLKLLLVISIFISSCSQESSKAVKTKKNERNNVIVKPKQSFKSYDLKMYNEKYNLKIYLNTFQQNQNNSAKIILTQNSDTVINQTLNLININSKLDTMASKGILEKLDLADKYMLSSIEYSFVRTESLYLTGSFKSLDEKDTLNLPIKFKYLGKDKGKFFVGVY